MLRHMPEVRARPALPWQVRPAGSRIRADDEAGRGTDEVLALRQRVAAQRIDVRQALIGLGGVEVVASRVGAIRRGFTPGLRSVPALACVGEAGEQLPALSGGRALAEIGRAVAACPEGRKNQSERSESHLPRGTLAAAPFVATAHNVGSERPRRTGKASSSRTISSRPRRIAAAAAFCRTRSTLADLGMARAFG